MKNIIIVILLAGMFLTASLTTIGSSNRINNEESNYTKMNNHVTQDYRVLIDYKPLPASVEARTLVAPAQVSNKLDWRDIDGKDFTTPAKDQKNCGSCWAFAAVGAVEAAAEIANNAPDWNPDFSEQCVISCTPAQGIHSNSCVGGHPYYAMQTMDEDGCLLEDCFRYEAVDENGCNLDENNNLDCSNDPVLCSDRTCSNFIDGIKDYGAANEHIGITRQEVIDQLQYGPVALAMELHEDFEAGEPGQGGSFHRNNIYRWDGEGESLGYHNVLCVGYNGDADDEDGYFICKNNWGEDWGNMDGFFKIYYGECGIDSVSMAWVTFDELDEIPAEIEITKPENAIYKDNEKIYPYVLPFILGNIDIQINEKDPNGIIDKVNFYYLDYPTLEKNKIGSDSTSPYKYNWNTPGVELLPKITAEAVDESGNIVATAEKQVFIFYNKDAQVCSTFQYSSGAKDMYQIEIDTGFSENDISEMKNYMDDSLGVDAKPMEIEFEYRVNFGDGGNEVVTTNDPTYTICHGYDKKTRASVDITIIVKTDSNTNGVFDSDEILSMTITGQEEKARQKILKNNFFMALLKIYPILQLLLKL